MTPYVLVRDLLRYQCGLTEADSPATLTTKVHQRLQALGIEAEEILPYLMHLLGVYVSDDRLAGLRLETIQARIFIALRQMTLTCSRQRPLIIAVEDLHWIDPTSDTWLASLVEYLTEVPIL